MSSEQFRLIIFHHHLLPGGVTDVIRHSVSSLSTMDAIESITIVCGRADNTEKMESHLKQLEQKGRKLRIELLPQLDYSGRPAASEDPEFLRKVLLEKYGSDHAVWLIHNYHLGKNWALTKALNTIAETQSQRMIYQIHDFPECARYGNLKELRTHINESLYPLSPSLRYCVINVRDYQIMKNAGMGENVIHLLENPVPAGDNPAGLKVDKEKLFTKLMQYKPADGRIAEGGDIWLYPVRSIRRKNVLEAGFLAALQEKPVNLILTLPGISPQEKKYSDLCEKAFARGLIKGFWGTGALPDEAGISYREMISAADLIFSPSVQEGFGYMYLNSLLWRKPLIARSLDIMGGFLPLMNGYPALFYKLVLVPGDSGLKKRTETGYRERFSELKNYLLPELEEKLERELENYLASDSLEFSYLSPEDQYRILEKLQDLSYRKECADLNRTTLGKMADLGSIPVRDKEKELYASYGEESYRQNFGKILNSFSGTESSEFSNNRKDRKIDGALQLEFTKLEFLRLLYR
ncbi:MAG: hypothetical protein PQJ58_11505 [Spirochaetales bacterium]|nr:hypothetical protein [Spirochaetales bacterium]